MHWVGSFNKESLPDMANVVGTWNLTTGHGNELTPSIPMAADTALGHHLHKLTGKTCRWTLTLVAWPADQWTRSPEPYSPL